MKNIIFNSEQVVAIDAIVDFIRNPVNLKDLTGWCIVIKGFAGTGKTTLVQEALRRVFSENENLNICVSAPTHDAVKVLSTFGAEAGINVDAKTIHSLTGLVLGENGETKRCFHGAEGSMQEYDVIILDEGSMAGNLIVDRISDIASLYGIKVIVLGDHGQLNPVGEGESRFFNEVEFPNVYYLTIDERTDKGSPIPKVVTQLRALAYNREIPEPFDTELTEQGDGVHFIKGFEFFETMLEEFDCEEYKKDHKYCRALAWTNREVDRMNRLIRQRLYGKKCPEFVEGEIVIVCDPVVVGNELVIATNTECKIVSLHTRMIEDLADFETFEDRHPEYKVWVIEVQLDGFTHRLISLHEDSRQDYNRRCNKLADRAHNKVGTWKSFWEFKKLFTTIKYSHATTVHKSQGQTIKNVFLQCRDIMRCKNNKERASLWYVGASRPTTNLVINLKQLK